MPDNRLPERKKVENETFAATSEPATSEPATSEPATSATETKPRRGRPKGSGKMTIQKYAANPPSLPKTDYQRIKELRELMIHSGGKDVANKVIQIALNDEHPGQMAALKMCLDRTLPVSMFEKDKHQRSAVTINITGLGQDPTVLEAIDV